MEPTGFAKQCRGCERGINYDFQTAQMCDLCYLLTGKYWERSRFRRGNYKFCYKCVKFEMPVRHSGRDVKWAVVYMCMAFKGVTSE